MINTISVLFVTRDPDLTDQIIGCIRYRGHAVRPKQAGNLPDLERLLQSHRFDAAVLIDSGLEVGLAEVSEAIRRAGRRTPVVLVSELGQEQSLRAIDAGAFAVVDRWSDDMAAVMTLRAVEHLYQGREVAHLRALLREADRRYLLMLDTSRYPIACFHEGAATYANEIWRDFFEIDLGESLDGLILNELVVPEQQAEFEQLLSELRKRSENSETRETLTLRTQQGRSFDADLLLTSAVIKGEPHIVIHLAVSDEEPALPHRGNPAIHRIADLGHPKEPGETGTRTSGSTSPAGTTTEKRPSVRHPDDAASEVQFLLDVHTMLEEMTRSERTIGLLVFAPDTARSDGELRSEVPGDDLMDFLKMKFPVPAAATRLRDGHYGILIPDPCHTELGREIDSVLKSAVGLNLAPDGGSEGSHTLSCGAVLADGTGPGAEELLQQAREALARARTAGGNRRLFHTRHGPAGGDLQADMMWKSRIEQAIRDDRLSLLYQPIVHLRGEDVPRYSVFLRLVGDDGQVHEPDEFLPPAERTGTAAQLDRWVIQQAVSALAGQIKRDNRTMFFLKLSLGSLDGEPVAEWLRHSLGRHQVPEKNVVVEFREPTLLTQPDSAASMAKDLLEMGVGLCVGDFGNGLEPFQILNQIDAAFIRLDGAFASRLAEDRSTQETVRDLTQTARRMDRQVIMPMIEDADTLTAAFSMEVSLVQGYFVQPPSEQLDFDFASGL